MFKKILNWIYQNVFLKLWLTLGALFTVSASTSCPCCGNPGCANGMAVSAILAGTCAAAAVFFRRIHQRLGRKGVFFLICVCVLMGFLAIRYFVVKDSRKKAWHPRPLRVGTGPRVSETPLTGVEGSLNIETKKPPQSDLQKEEAREPVSEATTQPLQRMKAVIGADGSVQIQNEEIDVVRYDAINFLKLNEDIYDRLSVYLGKQVEITGFVYRRENFLSNQFVTARLYMWCCEADAVPVGLLCESEIASDYKDGEWVRVRGVIEKKYFEDNLLDEKGDIPLVRVLDIQKIEKPDSPYVFSAKGPPVTPGKHKK